MTPAFPAVGETAAATPDFVSLTNSLCDAQTLLSALELDLFTALRSSGPADAETVRSALGLRGRGVSDWLDLLVLNGVLLRDGDKYRNTPAADQYLVRGADSYIGDVVRLRLFPALTHLTDSLRTGAPYGGEEFMSMVAGLDVLRQFANQMDHMTDSLMPHLVAAFDGWGRYGSVLDIGGCRGSVVAGILAAHPHLEGHVFDLPMMAPYLDEKRAERGLDGRLTFHPGDFLTDDLPPADIAIIGHALVNWDPGRQRALVRKAYDSVRPGGVFLVYDRMLGDAPGSTADQSLKVSLSMLVMTQGGRAYTTDELREYATGAGFDTVTFRPLGEHDTLAVCHKPA
ncbi:methyltransferase [Streptomyces sp. RFCAC02]|uniref:methyltransferase n=1 Tax=Streptomyces sp. RFCAC02 TaxID=2499143 RepID=UPI0010205DD5|nr:methyltransferase [Streptomyces sp. RFCAC02]